MKYIEMEFKKENVCNHIRVGSIFLWIWKRNVPSKYVLTFPSGRSWAGSSLWNLMRSLVKKEMVQ